MDDIEILPIEENDKFTNDRVYSALLIKRDNLIEKLYEVSPEVRDEYLDEIAETDKELLKIRRTRGIWGIPNTDEVEKHKSFDIEKFRETLLLESQHGDAFWAIADEYRDLKKKGYFDTYTAAYKCAAKQLTAISRPTTGMQLKKAFFKARKHGKVDK